MLRGPLSPTRSRGRCEGLERFAELGSVGTHQPVEHHPVSHEDERRPEFHLKRPSQRLPRTILDLEMLYGRVFVGQGDHAWRERTAISAPPRAQLNDQWTRYALELCPSRLMVLIAVTICHGIPANLRARGVAPASLYPEIRVETRLK